MERIAAGICGVVALGAAALFVLNLVNNPLDDRRAAHAEDLESIVPFDTDYSISGAGDYDLLRASISNKRAIWNELIEPPPPPAPVVQKIPPPDFVKLLKGVVPSKRKQMKDGVVVKIRFAYPGAGRRGKMHEVGDVIQNCKILAFNETTITFGYDQGGKQYTYDLPK